MKTYNSPSRIIFAALCAFLCALTARAQVNVSIGTLAPGESVTITYQVTIDDPLSPAITQISSQGAVTGLSGALGFSVNTDDPETPAADDATITPLQNDPPVVDLNGGTAGNDVTVAFTEGTPQLIAPVGTVTDVDGDDLVSLTATLTARPDGDGVESLSLNASATSAAAGATLTVGYTPATGVLLISGTAAASVYQTVLQGILYNNTSQNPTAGNRSVTVVASDTNPGTTRTSTITVIPVNDPPVVTAGNTIGYTEQQAVPPAISPLLTVTDPDSANLTGATIAITSGFVTGDTLNFSTQNGISGIYDGGTGTLTLSGSSTVANYQTALRSITFSSTSDNPTASGANPTRTLTYSATDGITSTTGATSTINVTPAADTPSVTGATTAEDTQTTSGLVIDRNAGDGTETTHFKITGISNGALFQNDGTTPIADGDFITFAQGNAGLRFTPSANLFSPSTTFGFTVQASTSASDAGLGGGTATASITVTPLADTPSVTSATTSEETQTTSGLVISRNALDGAEVTHFKITGISGGTLFQNDGVTPISPGDFITFAQGNAGLKFTPTANLYSPVNTFGITVQASLSAADAGVSGGAAPGVVTVDPVADTPSITSATTVEETQTTSGLVISRNAADSTEVTHFKITGISNGTLFQNDGTTPIANGDFITFAQGDAGLRFTPAADLSSPATTFGFDVQASLSAVDAGLGGGIATASITVNAVADTPSVTGATTLEDVQTTSGLVISRNAADSTEVTHFKITGISNGTLFQNDGTTPIANGDFITYAEGNAGLKFTPTANLYSPVTTTFGFTVQSSTAANDSGLGGGSTAASITVNAVADTPSVTAATTLEDTQTTSGLVISRNAADSTEVTHFKITGISNGTLFQNDGTTPIANGDFITFAEGDAGLKFTPAADLSSPATTFGFDVQASLSAADAGLGGGIATASITVNAVAETPSVTAATTLEDTQTTSGLVISRNAADSTEVTHFKITGISNGALFHNDGTTPIANGDFITFAQGNAGLKFTPGLNLNSPSTTFGFTVQASTSASDAGLGGATATAVITVTAVNDDPAAVTDTILRAPNDDTKVKVATLLLNDSDIDGGTLSITGVTSPSPGGATVSISGEWVLYKHGGTTADTFTYTLSDGQGGTSIGTVNVNIQGPDTQAGPAFQTPVVDGAGAHVSFDAIANRNYTVQSAPNPVAGPWTDRGSATEAGPGHYTFTDAIGSTATYYRAVYRP